jgi:hypothetical protein
MLGEYATQRLRCFESDTLASSPQIMRWRGWRGAAGLMAWRGKACGGHGARRKLPGPIHLRSRTVTNRHCHQPRQEHTQDGGGRVFLKAATESADSPDAARRRNCPIISDVSAPTQTSVSFHLIYIKAQPAALWLRQRASSEGRRPGAAITPNIEEGLRMPKHGMIVARYCRAASDRKQGAGVLKEPGHIVGIKRSVLETACSLAVALLPWLC